MDSLEPSEMRQETQRRRRAPDCSRVVRLPFGQGVRLDTLDAHPPLDLRLEATDSAGALATWLDDGWWTQLLSRWCDETVTVTLSPTRDALLHPVLLHQLEMLRRVALAWRLIGIAYRDDVRPNDPAAVRALSTSPYHEVRFLDAVRPVQTRRQESEACAPLADLLAAIRADQLRHGRTTPILVRAPIDAVDAAVSGDIAMDPSVAASSLSTR